MVGGPRQIALNGRMQLTFDGEVDPLSVTPSAVRLRDERGRSPAHRVRVDGRDVFVELRIDGACYADPPQRVDISLAGALSPHAISMLDGRRLDAGCVVSFEVSPKLESGDDGAFVVVDVNGRPVSSHAAADLDEPLVLGLDGVLDPASISPEGCPLYPQAAGLTLDPVAPRVDWELVGHRSRLTLHVEESAGPVQLQTRRWSVRSLDGASIEPPIVVDWTVR